MLEFIPQAIKENAFILSIVGVFCVYLIVDLLLRRSRNGTASVPYRRNGCATCGRSFGNVVWYCATCSRDLCCDCAFECLLKHGEVEAAPAENHDRP